MSKYAYIRVSCKDQKIDRQQAAMEKIGLTSKQMYIDIQSGKNFNRESYKKLIEKLEAGDELYIKSIDRLGRNYDDIIEQWIYLTKKKCVDIIILDFPLLDTRNAISGVTGKFVADVTLQVLSYVAQIERENTRQRQAEGIKIAKEKGVKFGRPKLPIPDKFKSVYSLYYQGKISKRECARRLNTNHSTLSKWIFKYEESNYLKQN